METPSEDLRTRLRNAIENDVTEDAIDCLRQGLSPDVSFELYDGSVTILAVSMCITNGRKAIMEELLRSGCSVNQQDSEGKTPLHYVAERGDEETMALFLSKQAEVNQGSHRGGSPLHLAALRGHLGMAKMLVEAGADVNACSKIFATPLHYACIRDRNWSVATYLLSKGASVDACGGSENTPLMAAAIFGRPDLKVLSTLLEAGTDINWRNVSGQNLLHIFLTKKYLSANDDEADLVEHMLSASYRCDVNAPDAKGRTPLHLAALQGGFKAAHLLIRAGCVLEREDEEKITPMGYALKCRHFRIIELLAAAGVFIPRPEWIEFRESLKDDPQRLKSLLEAGADFPKLSNLCRRAFREHFGDEARTRVENLPMCTMIKKYITFEIL